MINNFALLSDFKAQFCFYFNYSIPMGECLRPGFVLCKNKYSSGFRVICTRSRSFCNYQYSGSDSTHFTTCKAVRVYQHSGKVCNTPFQLQLQHCLMLCFIRYMSTSPGEVSPMLYLKRYMSNSPKKPSTPNMRSSEEPSTPNMRYSEEPSTPVSSITNICEQPSTSPDLFNIEKPDSIPTDSNQVCNHVDDHIYVTDLKEMVKDPTFRNLSRSEKKIKILKVPITELKEKESNEKEEQPKTLVEGLSFKPSTEEHVAWEVGGAA